MSQIVTPQMIEQKLRALSHEVDQSHKDLAEALEETGFQMLPDPMDISADTAKVLLIEEKKTGGAPDLQLVEDPA